MAQPIDVHYWPTPNGHKVTIALEEMELAYRVVPVNIGKGEQFKPDFLAISPNNRMPAIVDPEGPDGKPISIFESGAILQYLARKSGKFGGADPRAQAEVEQWLYWQMAGLGPMAGQAHHFRGYAPSILADQRQVAYGAIRYTDETHRLYSVLNKRLADRDYMAGDYSIADMAAYPWTLTWKLQGITLTEFPNLAAWQDRIAARETVKRAMLHSDVRNKVDLASAGKDPQGARNVLFGQRAR
jgi:GST-like protein